MRLNLKIQAIQKYIEDMYNQFRQHYCKDSLWLSGSRFVMCLYTLIFSIFFLNIRHGVGQYWDWTFPYFRSQIGNYFSSESLSWTSVQNGSPLGYTSDYFARFFISLFRFIQPETLLYLMLICIFSIGAFGVYLIAKKHVRSEIAFILGLAAFINPAIFYDYTGGYIDYFISLVIFIYLLNFMFSSFKRDLRSAVIVGLILGLIGTQIQFLVITPIFLAVYFLFNPSKWSWRHAIVLCALPVLLDLVWLSNFIVGASSISTLSATAGKLSFSNLSSSSYANIFNFSFSKATLISNFYNNHDLLVYFLFFVLLVSMLASKKRWHKQEVVLLVFLVMMIFFASGDFQAINLGPLTVFYPMLREVGHFASVIALALLLLFSLLIRRDKLGLLCVAVLIIGISISWGKFQNNSQKLNYGSMRTTLSQFETFNNTHQSSESRVLTYPFFDQYSIKQFGLPVGNNLPLRNVGYDSFELYSPGEFITNLVTPQNFQNSLQYKLLTTHDISVLQPYNVRYIYNLSGIWESYYNEYVPGSTYNNNLSLIKNDPNFLNELLKDNPGKLRRLSKNILEVLSYTPHVAASSKVFALASSSESDEATNRFVTQTLDDPFVYTENISNKAFGTSLTRLFYANDNLSKFNTKDDTITQSIPSTNTKHEQRTLFANPNQFEAFYNMQNNRLSVYEVSAGQLFIDGKPYTGDSNHTKRTLFNFNLVYGRKYYISVDGTAYSLHSGSSVELGPVSSGENLQLLSSDGSNLITNPSFKNGLWQSKVTDCDNYDNNPEISMSLSNVAFQAKHSLQLEATRHDACTFTSPFSLQPNKQYLLSYNHQSPTSSISRYYIAFNNSRNSPAEGSQATNNSTKWYLDTSLITTPASTVSGRLYVYSLESDGQQKNIVRYDNFSLGLANVLASTKVPSDSASYIKYTLPNTKSATTFTYHDSNYDYHNLIQDGSFKNGLWQSKVTDCDNYDNNPEISMSLSNVAFQAKHSLQLEATRHDACTYISTDVTANDTYLLEFSYKAKSQQAGYDVIFNNPKLSASAEHISVYDSNWHTYSAYIQAPQGATTLTLYLYALESDGVTQNVVNYDNVKLIAVPNFNNRYFVVGNPAQPLSQPKIIKFQTVDETKRVIKVDQANGPFILNLSETYNTKWRLELDNSKVSGFFDSWFPGARADSVPNTDHLDISDYANGWYINPAQLCRYGTAAGCSRNADGSYNLKLIAEFVPERWFTVNRAVSVLTLAVSTCYLVYTYRHLKKPRA